MSSQTCREEMSISERSLDCLRLRLIGKTMDILPSEGAVYEQDPVDT